ncbi:hypothetical protein LEP48_06060 [Isoptericola sp. NEAU-Y5]|uniref:Transcriptional regulator, AbiEi antitoxin, Type IV TA system n=1 Tax=Isoptericola luteus TaxID=2879484 RepID=A0ABS7ZDB5_9MICO|nr:hypothetical protein [Isoptericola sp. NEAU-Y5]MCA5892918.1 hypothetical protein [Isoptericola sp. NEAU-Y5]
MNDAARLLISREHDRAALRRAMADGALERVRRGAYRPSDGDPPRGRAHRLALDHVRATHQQLGARHVFSHVSAALVRGVPLWSAPTTTHLLQRSSASSRSARDIVRHRGLPDRWVEVDGLPVTDLVRTVVDCVTTLHPLEGLVVADWALAHGLDRDEAVAAVLARRRRNGRARGLLVLRSADGGAMPPWETWLRYLVLRLGLPRPETQFEVRTPVGKYFVDLAWVEHRVLAEFDGRIKYRDGEFGPGYDAERALFDEKVREDAITEHLGVRPRRFVARDAVDPRRSAERLLALFPPDVRRAARVNPLLPLPPARRS